LQQKRIVITGIGVVSPLGIGKDEFWESLRIGIPGIRAISLFDTSSLSVRQGGEIPNFDAAPYLGKKGLRTLDRSTLLLNTATKLALQDASLEINEGNTENIGVSVGTTFGSLHSISTFDRTGLTEGPKFVNPSLFPNTVINSPASQVSIRFGIKGFNTTISTGMCASADSIIYAMDFIKLGRASVVVTGGVEELCEETFLGFYKTGLLSGLNGSEFINCPFDKRRNGFVLSEGSAVIIIENLEHALSRGARIYAEIVGCGNSFDPANYKSGYPGGAGLKNAIEQALKDAALDSTEIDLICAHANSSRNGDRMESVVIRELFHDDLENLSISAIKSMIGETYSASGAFAVAASVGAINNSFVPPTLNYQMKDTECYVRGITNTAQAKSIRTAMIMSYDFHGNNSVVILKKY
jgi:3-oxoacyl-[acyl-carrier-protein] synthase II